MKTKTILSILVPGRVHSRVPIAIVLLMTFALSAQGAFVGDWALDNFALLNTNADGAWMSPDSGLSLILTGGNNGSGLGGKTYLLIFAPERAALSFQYSYATEDDPAWPEYDVGGYLAGGKFHPLSIAAATGNVTVVVDAGEGFGFGVETLDNWGGSASLTISRFQVQHVPEPASTAPVLVFTGYLIWRRSRYYRIWRRRL